MKRVVIAGSTGQDGSYLYEMALRRGHAVLGLGRHAVQSSDNHVLPAISITDGQAVASALASFRPDEIYYLAAHHHSSEQAQANTGELLFKSLETHVDGVIVFLEAMRKTVPRSRLFYAASSHVFGNPPHSPQTEDTPLAPISPYGISKAAGVEICRYYRRHHGLFCSSGILYNHESPRRPAHFLSQRIVRTAIEIKQGSASHLVVGNPNGEVDWGYAPDYVDAMMRILNTTAPEDFIVATGRLSKVRDFIANVFDYLGLEQQDRIVEDPALVKKPEQKQTLCGNSAKLRATTKWQPTHNLRDIARSMVDAALKVRDA